MNTELISCYHLTIVRIDLPNEEKFSGYAARIIQHEYDHIEGVLFTDYLSPLKRKLLKKKLSNITNGLIEIEYKMSFPKISKK